MYITIIINILCTLEPFFWFHIHGCIIDHFKLSINIIAMRRRTDKIQLLFHQRDQFSVVWIIYLKWSNTHCMMNIHNSVHKLYEVNMLTDIIYIVKCSSFLSFFKLIPNMLITFVYLLTKYDNIRQNNYILIPV